jgi:hypothetical protein
MDDSIPAQRAFSFRAFLRQNVALESLGPDDLAGSRLFESLGGGAIGSDFGHYGHPPYDSEFASPKTRFLPGPGTIPKKLFGSRSHRKSFFREVEAGQSLISRIASRDFCPDRYSAKTIVYF